MEKDAVLPGEQPGTQSEWPTGDGRPPVAAAVRANLWSKLRKRRDWRIAALIIVGVLCLLAIAATVLLEGWVVPMIWRWGVRDYHTSFLYFVKAATGIVAAIFLASISFSPLIIFSPFWQIVSLYFDDADDQFQVKLAATKQAQHDAEEKLKVIEGQDDSTGLIQLVQYSRLQLDQYYTIAIRQTQQSFRYSVVAMWIGFVVMIGGIAPFVLPLINPSLRTEPSTSINVVIAAGGFVIELIAALFLWVYRSSIVQLTYFYNRQIYLHNVLLCYKIAATMKPDQEPKSLDSRALIIEKVLDSTWNIDRPEAPTSKGIRELITPAKAAAAAG